MRLFHGLILAWAIYASTGFAHAQTIHPVDLDGTTINFVVPEGYCVLDRTNPAHRTIFDHYYGEDDATIRVVLFFVECEGLGAFTTIDESLDRVSDNGVYYTNLNPDGSVKTFPGLDRTAFVKYFAEQLPDLPLAIARAELSDALDETGGPPVEFFQSGLTEYDADALYVTLLATSEVTGEARIVGGSAATTFVHERGIFLGLSRLMDDKDAIDRLSDEARQLMAAFLVANPNSDN
jgi:hypothetical protein